MQSGNKRVSGMFYLLNGENLQGKVSRQKCCVHVAGMLRLAWAGLSHMSGIWPARISRRQLATSARRYAQSLLMVPRSSAVLSFDNSSQLWLQDLSTSCSFRKEVILIFMGVCMFQLVSGDFQGKRVTVLYRSYLGPYDAMGLRILG